jgi:hypothetical protein
MARKTAVKVKKSELISALRTRLAEELAKEKESKRTFSKRFSLYRLAISVQLSKAARDAAKAKTVKAVIGCTERWGYRSKPERPEVYKSSSKCRIEDVISLLEMSTDTIMKLDESSEYFRLLRYGKCS